MGSFSAPMVIQLLVTTEEPITPSPIGKDQKLWEDKINPQVWDKGIPGWTHQAELVVIALEKPPGLQTGNNTPSKEKLRKDFSL